MKVLEVELDLQDPSSLLRAVDKFVAREVIIEDAEQGQLQGIILAKKGRKNYLFRTYPDKKSIEDRTLDYRDLRKMQLINPRKEDYRIARMGYQEITENTIRVTMLASRRTSR